MFNARLLGRLGWLIAWALYAWPVLAMPDVARAAPVEAYGRLPDLENVGISPDGTRLAFAGAIGEQRVVSVINIADKKPVLVLKTGNDKIRSLSWIDDDNLLIVNSTTGKPPRGLIGGVQEFSFANVLNISSHAVVQLKPPKDVAGGTLNTIAGMPIVRRMWDRSHVYFEAVRVDRVGSYRQLYVYDVPSREISSLGEGHRTTLAYFVGRNSDEIADSTWDKGVWTLRLKIKGAWKSLPAVTGLSGPPSFAGLDPSSKAIVFRGSVGAKDTGAWHALSLDDGEWHVANYSGSDLITDVQSGAALGVQRETDRYSYGFFDASLQKSWTDIRAAFPGEQVDFVSISKDHKKVVVKVFGQISGAAYMLVDLNSGQADLIGYLYSQAPPDQVADAKPIVYAAADGLQIPAYLTLPKGRDPQNLPLVVLVHGGPQARDHLEFDWMAQALASRGYAVLQSEYRGSGDLSNDLFKAGLGQWGRKMQTDLSDGVRYLAGKGTIDPKRVCIAGASYGGYAALAGATLDTGVYRCAVDVSGPSDLAEMVKYSAGRSYDSDHTIAYWDRYMEAEAQKDPTYADISPIRHVDRIAIPVMIIHGKDDTVVPFQQSQWMVDRMESARKRVEFVSLSGEDHWMSRSQTRQKMLTSMIKFIETNNPAGAPTSSAKP